MFHPIFLIHETAVKGGPRNHETEIGYFFRIFGVISKIFLHGVGPVALELIVQEASEDVQNCNFSRPFLRVPSLSAYSAAASKVSNLS